MAPSRIACRPLALRLTQSLMLVCALLAFSRQAAAQSDPTMALMQPNLPVDTPSIRIDWPAFLIPPAQDEEDHAAAMKITARACRNLGQALLAGRGGWGLGLFSTFSCYHASDKGSDQTPFAGTAKAARSMWTLKISKDGDDLELAVYYEAPDQPNKPIRVARVTTKANIWTQDLLGDRKYASILAAMVLDAMPAVRRFAPLADPSSKTVELPLDIGKPGPPRLRTIRPDALALFTWSLNPETRLWMPHIVGSATIVGSKPKLSWRLTFKESPGRKPIFAQSPKGPGTRQIQAQALLKKHQKTLLTKTETPGFSKIREGVASAARFMILDNVESGFIGVRVGRELIDPSSAVIPPATIISALGEFRSGFASGLRFYLDVVPRHGSSANGEDLWVGYNRFVVGYNFGLKLSHVVDRLELAPKIGAWNVNSRLAAFASEDSDTVIYRAFNLNFALSLGIEVGAVWEGESYFLRLWYGRDLSNPFLKVADVRRKVLSSRLGADAMFKGPPISLFGKNWRLGYLVFGYYESLTFTQESTNNGNFQLEFTSPYAGGGLSLAW